jgi:hypothetical protein
VPENPTPPTEQEAIAASFRNSLEDTISVLEGVGPLCSDIDELVKMLELALRNESQLQLIMAHLTPKRMK